MDIDAANFTRQLLPILKHISNASFVTIDLEMSGISTQPSSGARKAGKPSLQDFYEDMKAAADTYATVQMGITIVEEDKERDFWLARPYNFFVTPLQAHGADLKLERDVCFNTASCEFLMKSNFDFGRMFTHGVPYLGRNEEALVREQYKSRNDRSTTIPDMVVPASDIDALAFYRDARRTITTWVEDTKTDIDYVNIGSHLATLSSYQRRLVYQLVRSEFPSLRAFPRNGGAFMQVEKLNPKREAEQQKKRDQSFELAIAKQTGLRWIFEALAGGDLTNIDPLWFYREGDELPDRNLVQKLTRELKAITKKLKTKKHIIVGHNLFTDLGFIYNTFIGALPTNVKHFQEDVNELFPIVFDTKYLATQSEVYAHSRSGLRELLEPFRKIHQPMIALHEAHTRYGSSMDHEAGYDSWMTAELFVKLSSKLYQERKATLEPDSPSTDENSNDDDIGGVSLDSNRERGALSESDSEERLPIAWLARKLQGNSFSALLDHKDSDDEGDFGPGFGDGAAEGGANGEGKGDEWFMPASSSSFWDAYKNKLRVMAVEGGVCDLAQGYY